MELQKLLTPKQLAERLNVSVRVIRDWIFKGKINSLIVRVGRLVRFDPVKIEERIKSGKILD